MVYYRKYRPQLISELDLDSVREKLSAILSSKDLPHAFLFTGSKGLGKTSAARILAKAINCEVRVQVSGSRDQGKEKLDPRPQNLEPSIEPCNECQACVSITNGSNIDVLEIDAASNGGVEEIRTLRERVKFAPSMLHKKVYIIDEVHMLSTGAFNALLKTLEEPPSHVVFVLATTELWKLPPTVVSRTFQVQFEKPTSVQMARSLERIVKGESLKIDKEVLLKISEISDGAFRDAAKNLEELALASKGEKITLEIFDKAFNVKGLHGEVYDLLNCYARRDAKTALEIIAKFYEGGADFKVVFERIVDHLRGLLMLRNQIPSEEKDVEGLNMTNIQALLELSNEAYGELRMSIIPQLPLELMTVKYCVLDSQEESGVRSQKVEDRSERMEAKVQKTESPVIAPARPFGGSEPKQSNTHSDLLKQLMDKVNLVNKPAAALLRSCKSAQVEEGTLVIVTPFPIHADRLKSEKVLPDIEKAAEQILGKKVEISISSLS